MLSLQSSKVCKADESVDRVRNNGDWGEVAKEGWEDIDTNFLKGGEVDCIDQGRQTFQYDESGHPPNPILEISH